MICFAASELIFLCLLFAVCFKYAIYLSAVLVVVLLFMHVFYLCYETVFHENYKYATLCYLSIFNHYAAVLFLLLNYEVACIALNMDFFKYLI